MGAFHSDRDWEALGRHDPYWAVLTDERFHQPRLTADAVTEFYQSGEQYIAWVWDKIEAHLVERFAPRRALDFGCGVGRLVMPLAQRCEAVVGVDVAESMLAIARAKANELRLTNVQFVQGDDGVSRVRQTFDLIHSYIVFQHIPCARGLAILHRLFDLLDDGGVGVIHLTYFNPNLHRSWVKKIRHAVKSRLMRLQGRPQIEMNEYPLHEVFRMIQAAGMRQCHLELTNHGGCEGMIIFLQKARPTEYHA